MQDAPLATVRAVDQGLSITSPVTSIAVIMPLDQPLVNGVTKTDTGAYPTQISMLIAVIL